MAVCCEIFGESQVRKRSKKAERLELHVKRVRASCEIKSVVEVVMIVACRGVKVLKAEEPMENSIDAKSQ